MKSPTLPTVVRDVLEDTLSHPVSEAVAQGRRPVAYTCSYVPEPLLSVGDLLPLRLRAPGVVGTPLADTYLSSVICSYCRSLLEGALDGQYDFVQGWVFAASCDHGRRLYDNLVYLQKPPFVHILDVPHKSDDPALQWYVEELRRLAAALSEQLGVDTGAAALRDAIRTHNGHLDRLRAISDLRLRDPPPVTGAFVHALITACASAPRERLAATLEQVHAGLVEAEPVAPVRARVMVVGSQLDDPSWLRVVESQGALVVADRCCTGSLPGLEPIREDGDPLVALAEHTLRRTRCPRMMEDFPARLEDILRTARTHRVDGIILESLKFCDLWGVESSALTEALREAGLPVLRVEREYALSGEGQLRTRVQAFLESLGR